MTIPSEMMVEMYQFNPTGVRTFDPLNMKEDEELNASKTQGTPPGAQEARPEEEAATAFKEALRLHPQDQLSRIYVQRCMSLKARPPAGSWDGVWVMDEK